MKSKEKSENRNIAKLDQKNELLEEVNNNVNKNEKNNINVDTPRKSLNNNKNDLNRNLKENNFINKKITYIYDEEEKKKNF